MSNAVPNDIPPDGGLLQEHQSDIGVQTHS